MPSARFIRRSGAHDFLTAPAVASRIAVYVGWEAMSFGALIRRKLSPASRDEIALESTSFSLSLDVPRPVERRSEERLLAMLPLIKLSFGDVRSLGRVRSLSGGGLMAEVTTVPPIETALELEFSSSAKVPGHVVWVRGSSVGVKFDRDVDLRDLLSHKRPRGGQVTRPPRLEITCGATIRVDGFYHKVELRDISQGGMKVWLREWQTPGKPVVVTIDSFRPVRGVIRWFKEGQAGIVFDKPLSFEELAEWLGRRVELASLKSGAWDQRRR